jgi:RNA polymerase sigma factor (sigma-70 family)
LPSEEQRLFVADLAGKHGTRLRRYLAVRLRNVVDVGDLAQEIFLRLLRVERHDLIRKPEAYLFTIASHVLHQHALNQAAAPESWDPIDLATDQHFAVESDPAAHLHLERRLEALDRALERLSPKTRAAFVLHRRDGCTVDEVAAKLGISRSSVKKHLTKAMIHCSRQLEPS